MTDPTLRLAQALIQRSSVTPEDGGCQLLLIQRLEKLGFHIERLASGPVSNFWARKGNTEPVLAFAGHTDVVPTGPRELWQSDPFIPTLRDGLLYGRGAADMKGSLSAFITATESFLSTYPQPRGSIVFLITSDEEGDAIEGTVKLIDLLRSRGETLNYCIVGEPTCEEVLGDTIKNGRRGSLSGVLTVKGIQGHIAYPHLASNPIHTFAPVLAALAKTVWDKGNKSFPPTTWQVSNIQGGTGASNVIPGTVEVQFNFRFSTESTVDSLKKRFHEILDQHALSYDLQWRLNGEPYLTSEGSLLAATSEAIMEVCGIGPHLSTSGGTSDGRFIAQYCPQVIEFGPLNKTIHQIDECVGVKDLEQLSIIYKKIMEKLIA